MNGSSLAGPLIRLTHLQKVVDQSTLVDIELLVVEAGEIAAVVGLRNQNKVALLELLAGRSQPTAGTVEVAGLNPAAAQPELARRLGVLLADNALYPRLSVRENLAFYARLYGLPPGRVEEVLAQVGLADRATARASVLSPGLGRRLAFGRAILHRPVVLLLVEPFGDCDNSSAELLARLVGQWAVDGVAVLVLAADAATVASLCRTIHVAENGRLSRSYNPGAEGRVDLPFKIPARLEDKVVLVNPGDILYATVENGQSYLQTAGGRIPTHLNLSELEERLARSGFFRAHRSYLVNLQHVKEVISYTRDSFTLILDGPGPAEIPLSKHSARELRELLGY
ncbi:MAG: LytTR family transcriptional regulator DNA-binding domain-containing protein [Chloroflexi bacterium]|nr:LytTR family transcriptional regulator DNA-binding domain-containing protein [Chloroflexota bacterium]MCI0577377.1 LytTR family transcriptional regulator DNA-binding domain-containing protein [Chloroflexota bacterium]MCI0647064.1 LytTR family transcriptional regulator DNA-binding domain-containing protein [Chloroflexota bacterium]MCI0731551.1 LytTR family transcriptional regulator DNA-binding domain-containing protein [Chloroflexota bacterium]